MEALYENIFLLDWRYIVMWIIGGVLIFLAIKKDMEPTLLLPIGFGTLLVNIPLSSAIGEDGALTTLFNAGIANELFPLILFIGIGAMIDFEPLLVNPKLMIFGRGGTIRHLFTLCTASMFFDINDAASIAIIGAADGPTSIVVAAAVGIEISGRYHGGGLFLYGSGADYSAADHQADDDQEGTSDPDGVQRKKGTKDRENFIPDCHYHGDWNRGAFLCFSGWLFDVRQLDSGVRRLKFLVGNCTEGSGKSCDDIPWHYDRISNDCGILPALGYSADSCIGYVCVYI